MKNYFSRWKNYFGRWKIFFCRAGGKIILAGWKIILAGEKIIWAGGKIILAGLVTTRQSHPFRAHEAREFLKNTSITQCTDDIINKNNILNFYSIFCSRYSFPVPILSAAQLLASSRNNQVSSVHTIDENW